MVNDVLLASPRYVVLDSAHFGHLVADWMSGDRERQRAAQRFVPELIESGWIPLLCWHHLEELLQHSNDELVDARLRFLWSLPLLAWVKSCSPDLPLGSVLDLLTSEVSAATANPSADALEVRALARDAVLAVGPGTKAVPEQFRDWRVLKQAFGRRREEALKVTAIARWRAEASIDNTRVAEWTQLPIRSREGRARALSTMRERLTQEIAMRGDKRIAEPAAMADQFIAEIADAGTAISAGGTLSPAMQLLVAAGLDPEDIDSTATLAEMMSLLMFHDRLRLAARSAGIPWTTVKRSVTAQRLPVTIIEQSMRAHSQDLPERKGSELNDVHLLCLAPYAHVTYVDKRTLENVNRARRHVPMFSHLVGQVERASSPAQISKALGRGGSLR